MKKKKLTIVLVALIFLLAVGLSYLVNLLNPVSPIETVKEPRDLYYCKQDKDCGKVDRDCCGCTSGGSATTINKKYSDYWETRCKPTHCLAVLSNHWTCFAEPKCINNKCELVK